MNMESVGGLTTTKEGRKQRKNHDLFITSNPEFIYPGKTIRIKLSLLENMHTWYTPTERQTKGTQFICRLYAKSVFYQAGSMKRIKSKKKRILPQLLPA